MKRERGYEGKRKKTWKKSNKLDIILVMRNGNVLIDDLRQRQYDLLSFTL